MNFKKRLVERYYLYSLNNGELFDSWVLTRIQSTVQYMMEYIAFTYIIKGIFFF